MPTDTTLRDYLIDEFVEDYVERKMTRRDAMKRLAAITGSLSAASAILAACSPAPTVAPAAAPSATAAPATATSVPPTATSAPPTATATSAAPASPNVKADDPAITAMTVEFTGPAGKLMGYMASPKGAGPFPAILVCHENRGLTEYVNDVTRRVAKAGYVGLAVDLLSREGGTASIKDAAQAPGILGNAAPERFIEDFQAGMKHLQAQTNVRKDRIGMVGFCFGGGITWRVATKTPELRAAVPFYGPAPMAADIPGVKAAVLAIYAGLDARITGSMPAMEAAMKENGKTFEGMVYPEVNHAFHNDTGGAYNAPAAAAAWARTLAWFDKYVKA
ncbi:MAG: dienelactone hydrolase family protein [Chloroflexi bacterium]|nr:dienelactone hydrolase family protein [Chloroflexota bacterium]